MKTTRSETDTERKARIARELHQDQRERAAGYRSRALKLFPHVCGSCGREFNGKRLRELTVHHKDFDFKNNPPDGSNWELLCLYCHDHEHETHLRRAGSRKSVTVGEAAPPVSNPFENLDQLMNGE